MKLIMKFGGTSMAGSEKIRHAASLVAQALRQHHVVAVVSAMDGVTEQLLAIADHAEAGDRSSVEQVLSQVRSAHESTSDALGCLAETRELLSRLESLATGIMAVGECTARSRDAVVSFGERMSTRFMAAALGVACGSPARGFDGGDAGIVTNNHFGEADPLMDISLMQVRDRLAPLVEARTPVVVAGFIAQTQSGVMSTIGRGGSDYTATILGAALGADEIHIWSDVDGLMTADPRLVPGARLLSHLTFAEAIEMGKFGAKSMHPRALEPAAEHGIPVRMRNTFKPDNPGTLIGSAVGQPDARRPGETAVRSVPMLKNMAMITVGGAGMIGRPGTAAALFDALAAARINVHMICQSVSEAGISVVVSMAQLDRAKAALERSMRPFIGTRTIHAPATSDTSASAPVLHGIDVVGNIAIVAPVGSGMRGVPGVVARIFSAVARKNLNIIAIAQGSSELSVCFAVDKDAGPEAVRAVHEEFDSR
ncbi:MAG: aspartate kinase [Phycisphaerales bacterium]